MGFPMTNNTIMYGIRNAPPPFSYATNGKRHILPRPTEVAMHDIRNSVLFDQFGRSLLVGYVQKCKKNVYKYEIKCDT